MYWHVDVDNKAIFGYDIGSYGASSWTISLKIEYDSELKFEISQLGNSYYASMDSDERNFVELSDAVDLLLTFYPDNTEMSEAFRGYLDRNPKKVYTITPSGTILTHVILHENCSIAISCLCYKSNTNEVIRTSPNSFYTDLSFIQQYETEEQAIQAVIGSMEFKYERERGSWEKISEEVTEEPGMFYWSTHGTRSSIIFKAISGDKSGVYKVIEEIHIDPSGNFVKDKVNYPLHLSTEDISRVRSTFPEALEESVEYLRGEMEILVSRINNLEELL